MATAASVLRQLHVYLASKGRQLRGRPWGRPRSCFMLRICHTGHTPGSVVRQRCIDKGQIFVVSIVVLRAEILIN